MTGENKNNKHAFKKYLADEMSAAERNSFEKELQKDAFEAEALEGFDTIDKDTLTSDLNELQARINTPGRRNKLTYFAAAASILLLITSGIIWMQLSRENPTPEVSENVIQNETTESKQESVDAEETTIEIKEEVHSDNTETKTVLHQPDIEEEKDEIVVVPDDFEFEDDSELTAEKDIPEQKTRPIEQTVTTTDIVQSTATNNKMTVNIPDKKEEMVLAIPSASAPTKKSNVISGRIISAEDQLPIAGATLMIKGTSKGTISDIDGNFQIKIENDSNAILVASFIGMEAQEIVLKSNSNNLIQLETDDVGLSEVVVVGYGRQRKSSTRSYSVQTTKGENKPAEPVCGTGSYKDILKENAILPSDYPGQRLVAKLILHIDDQGEISKIENANRIDEEIFKKAEKIIMEAPGWNAKLENGINVSSQVKVRIVFRKK